MQHWNNIDIELFDHDTVGDIESVRVRVARSPAGVQRDPIKVKIPKTLRDAQDALGADSLDLEQTIALGQLLSKILFPGEAAELFENSCAALAADHGLRIRIELRSLQLADLPWEYVYREPADADGSAPERGFLALDRTLSLVRYEPVAKAPVSCKPLKGAPVKVAMLLANPDIPGWAKLDLEREIKAVESALDDEPDVTLDVQRNATGHSLNDSLDSRPHVFHFAGHGRFKMQPSEDFGVYVGKGELLLEDEQGELDGLSAQELANKMRGSGVRLAVLNSCESARRDTLNAFTGVAPTLVREGVPAVVAMQFNIRDEHALQFARRFYRNLARHQSIDDAITAARLAMFNLGGAYSRDWGLPVLYLRSNEAIIFPEKVRFRSGLQKLGVRGVLNIALATLLVIVLLLFYAWQIEPRLPVGKFVWGVIVAAGLAGIGFLRYLAGDSLRVALLFWLRRKIATGILASSLLVSSIGLFMLPEPTMLRILPGKTLMSLLAEADIDNTPQRIYRLKLQLGNLQETQNLDFVTEDPDFRKSGVTLSSSIGLAAQLSERHSDLIVADIESYADREGLGDFKRRYVSLWQNQPKTLTLKELGSAKRLTLSLENDEGLVACKSVELSENILIVMLEKNNEC